LSNSGKKIFIKYFHSHNFIPGAPGKHEANIFSPFVDIPGFIFYTFKHMDHFLVLYYILIALGGFIALTITILGTLKSGIATYWFLILFYGSFTLQICVLFIRRYMFVNITGFSYEMALATYQAAGVLSFMLVTTMTLYHHRVFHVKFQKSRDILVISLMTLGSLFFFLPFSAELDQTHGLVKRHPLLLAGAAVYLLVFLYLLVLIARGSKKDRPARELILIWGSFIFGIIGFCETMLGFIHQFTSPEVLLSADNRGFLFSTIPYVLFGGVLFYYFGAYLLAEKRPPHRLPGDLMQKYGISPREQEVISLMNRGLSNREIAEKLFISLSTVKTHAHNIYEKTGTKSRYDLFHLVKKVPPPDLS
jgi:DNA-binding CsgD family transcriptional regulator